MKKIVLLIMIGMLVLPVHYLTVEIVSSDQGTSYYVANDGDDSNDGLSPATAWQTISKVSSEMDSGGIIQGDDIYFNRGDSWSLSYSFDVDRGGTSSNEMIIGAYGSGAKPIFSRSDGGNQVIYCNYENMGYVTFQDLQFSNNAHGIFFYNGGHDNHDITIRNVDTVNCKIAKFYNVRDVLIENCNIDPNSGSNHGISIQYDSSGSFQCGNFIIRNCTISDVKDGISIHFGGTNENNNLGNNFWIENCVISNTNEECIDVVGGYGCENILIQNCEMYDCRNLVVGHGQSNVVIDNVYIHDVGGNAFTLTRSYNVIMRNSVIYKWGGSKNGICRNANQYSPDETENVCIYNNDIISDGDPDHIQFNNENVNGIVFKNNIFLSTAQSSPGLFMHYISPATLSNTNSEYSHNMWWRGDGGSGDDTWWSDAAGNYDFDDWLAKGEVSNDLRDDPELIDPSSDDFSLSSSSPCIDAGDWLTSCNGGGSGTVITVDEAGYFFPGISDLGVPGDNIFVGDDTNLEIVAVNYNSNTITVDRSISWSNGDDVSLSSFNGNAPDIGAVESLITEPLGSNPEISNVLSIESDPLDTDPLFGWVNITSDVTADSGLSDVRLIVTYPDSSTDNVSMVDGGSGNYYYYTSTMFSDYGDYSYYIWAIDQNGNQSISDIENFAMSPNWDVDENGVCNVEDLTLISNHYNEEGQNGWIREDVDNNGIVQILDFVQVSAHYGETW
jgi:hypothetical protein